MSDVLERLLALAADDDWRPENIARLRADLTALRAATWHCWRCSKRVAGPCVDPACPGGGAASAEIARLRAELAAARADLAMAREREGMTGLEYRGG